MKIGLSYKFRELAMFKTQSVARYVATYVYIRVCKDWIFSYVEATLIAALH